MGSKNSTVENLTAPGQPTNLVYNSAAKVLSRRRIFHSAHPANHKYSNSIDAVFHDDGSVSAVVLSNRPWHAMELAFAPGFFDAIELYLIRTKIQEEVEDGDSKEAV